MAIRINPSEISGTIAGTALTDALGPYRFRGGPSCQGVRISASSTNATDVGKIYFTEPGVALVTNDAEAPIVSNVPTTLTVPFSIVLDTNQMGGAVDIYLAAPTKAGTFTGRIQKVVQ